MSQSSVSKLYADAAKYLFDSRTKQAIRSFSQANGFTARPGFLRSAAGAILGSASISLAATYLFALITGRAANLDIFAITTFFLYTVLRFSYYEEDIGTYRGREFAIHYDDRFKNVPYVGYVQIGMRNSRPMRSEIVQASPGYTPFIIRKPLRPAEQIIGEKEAQTSAPEICRNMMIEAGRTWSTMRVYAGFVTTAEDIETMIDYGLPLVDAQPPALIP